MKKSIKALLTIVLLCATAAMSAQEEMSIRDIFKAMPDSLIPYLSTNNRLDMIDFMDAQMKAEVTNKLDGKSEMVALTDDSLCIVLSQALKVDLKLEKVDTGVVVCLKRIYALKGQPAEEVADYYTADWRYIDSRRLWSGLLRRDEEIQEKPHF